MQPLSLHPHSLIRKGKVMSCQHNFATNVPLPTLLQLLLGAVLVNVAEARSNHIPHLHHWVRSQYESLSCTGVDAHCLARRTSSSSTSISSLEASSKSSTSVCWTSSVQVCI